MSINFHVFLFFNGVEHQGKSYESSLQGAINPPRLKRLLSYTFPLNLPDAGGSVCQKQALYLIYCKTQQQQVSVSLILQGYCYTNIAKNGSILALLYRKNTKKNGCSWREAFKSLQNACKRHKFSLWSAVKKPP